MKVGIGNKEITYSIPVPEYPAALANRLFWYDPSDLTTITKDGSNFVSRWNDKLGNGKDLIQNTSTSQPLWTANTVLFDGLADLMEASFVWNQPAFIYMIVKQVTWTRYRRIFGSYGTSISYLWQDDTTPGLKAFAGTASAQNNNLAVDTWGIVRVLLNGVNSKLQINATAATTGDFGTAAMNGFTLAARGGASNPSNIQVRDVIGMPSTEGESGIYAWLVTRM